ncbi:solute carrier family 46 member 3-like [Rana temporaria]|uniref:solute carrier family 46 member 3-like n=1 Tax=Rana temporaria TaxID=8407 RepID=UPI001AADDD4A|nr:solute carrier family 46 member 3-like [Rana temporaria]
MTNVHLMQDCLQIEFIAKSEAISFPEFPRLHPNQSQVVLCADNIEITPATVTSEKITQPFCCVSLCATWSVEKRKSSKELSENLRTYILEKHGQSQGYKCISRDFNVPMSTVHNIVKKFTAYATVVYLHEHKRKIDQRRRKVSLLLPSIGGLITVTAYCLVSFFKWPLEVLFLSSVLSGFLGGFATFLGGCFSYIADIAKDIQKKNIRIAFIDIVFGVSSGISGITSGYIITALGFKWSFFIPAILHILNILNIIFILEETIKRAEFYNPVLSKEGVKELFSRVFLLFKHSSCKKRLTIGLLLFAFMFFLFANFGAVNLFTQWRATLYELDSPLCWDPVLIGWGSALSTFCFIGSFRGVFLFTQCLKDFYIVLIGMASWIGGIIMAAFATTTVTMVLGKVHCDKPVQFIPYGYILF